jgi:molecular chaperone GrpE
MPMTNEAKKPAPGELAGDELGDAAGQATEAGAAAAQDGSPEQVLQQAQDQIAELTSRLARAQADHENYRRRMQKEKEDVAVYANQKLLLNLLPVLDNLDRALATLPATGDEKLRQGVEMTARSFREILARENVVAIEAVGQAFDPNVHEAVMTIDSDEHPDGTVLVELQKGYRLGDRVIRPTMVQVSKQG